MTMMINDVAHYRYYLLLLLVHSAILLFSSAFSATAMNGGALHSSLLTTETSSSDDDITNTATLTTTTMSVEQTRHDDKQKTPHRRRRYYSPFLPLPTDNNYNNNDRQPSQASALIILNTPIPTTTTTTDDNNNNQLLLLPEVFQRLWESTTFHVCADGGANRLYDATIKRTHRHHDIDIVTTTTDSKFLPDLITGDLDSLRPNVKSYYEQRGVPIVTVQDQNYHDLDKSLMAVEQWIMKGVENNNNSKKQKQERQHDNYCNEETDTITITTTTSSTTTTPTTNCFIYGGFGGRFDQEMACINTLYSWGKKESFQNTQMSIYNEETGVILLSSEGKKPPMMIVNEIWIRFPDVVLLEEEGNDKNDNNNNKEEEVEGNHVESSEQNEEEVAAAAEVGEGPTCGLIPIGGRCETVYTSGLKWNLNGDIPLEFGGLVSSSNRIVDKVVTVMTSSPLLFSFEIVKRYKKNV
jgi:thiamine pyrophosphokinase